jgi:hypothetical protein
MEKLFKFTYVASFAIIESINQIRCLVLLSYRKIWPVFRLDDCLGCFGFEADPHSILITQIFTKTFHPFVDLLKKERDFIIFCTY